MLQSKGILAYIQRKGKLYIHKKQKISSIGRCNYSNCSTSTKNSKKSRSSSCCQFKFIDGDDIQNYFDDYTPTTTKIYGWRINWEVTDQYLSHFNSKSCKNILRWGRNIYIDSSNIDGRPVIGIQNPDWSKDHPKLYRKYFEIFSIGPHSNCWITDNLIYWVLRKQVQDGIGQSMYFYIFLTYYQYTIYILFTYF